MLPPLKPIAMKERVSMIFIERGQIDVLDGAFVVVDKNGTRTHIPVGSAACLMLEPGTRVSHRAVALAARVGTLLVWVGEAGVRLYASGQPGGACSPVTTANLGTFSTAATHGPVLPFSTPSPPMNRTIRMAPGTANPSAMPQNSALGTGLHSYLR